MPHKIPIDLENRIIAALTDTGTELWFPNLTYDLVQSGWQKLYQEIGVSEEYYSTARVILKNMNAYSITEGSVFICKNLEDNKKGIFIEMLPASIIEQYKKSGVDFYTEDELYINAEIMQCLKDAFEIIKGVPNLFSMVCCLIKSIHLIKPKDDEYDVSFSEPHIPFSIFISIPQKNDSINILRVAEAIIHEAMHLLLTLIERIIPLVVENDNLYFSPWKSEFRNIVGILHALYVFRVIYAFYGQLVHCLPSKKHKNYITERQNLISQEIAKVNEIDLFPDLTNIGRLFASRLTANQG